MSLPGYHLDPPEEREVQCWTCDGAGYHAVGREVVIVDDCEECEGSGTVMLGPVAYTNYLRMMKERD